jgi:type 1 glutamine amidotransferase
MSNGSPPGAIIVSGGVAHDFEASSPALARVLGEVGFETEVTQDIEGALSGLTGAPTPPLLVINLLRWSMNVERYAHLREQWSLSLDAAAREALLTHLARGGGVLAMHGASICFDDWAEWRSILGGTWDWDRSFHPPIADDPVKIHVVERTHPIVAGIDDFEIVDEVYGFLDLAPDVVGLLSSSHGGTEHPLLWARDVLGGRIVYDALGHDTRSYDAPEHRLIVQRAALWATGSLREQ